jgi:Contractile injection system tape measure protein
MPAPPSPHRLRRLRWQAQAPDATQALALRALLRGQGDAVQQVLEQALDEAAATLGLPPDTVVHLPRLDLAVPQPPAANPVRPAPEQAAAWSQWLQQVQRAVQAEVQVQTQARQHRLPDALRGVTEGPLGAARVQAAAMQARQALRGYLLSGWPGWALAGVDQAQAALQASAADLAGEWVPDDSRGLAAGHLQALWDWTGCNPGAPALGVLARWLALLPAAQRARWVQAKGPSQLALPLDTGSGAATRAALLRAWQAEAASGRSLWAQALWLAWPESGGSQAPWLAALEAATGPETRAPDALTRLQVALRAQPPPGTHLATQTQAAGARQPAPGGDGAAQARTLDHALPAAPADDADTHHLVVPLAGLVLLHPYLARLLQGLHLHSGQVGEPLAPAVWPRALALLHALACGHTGTAALELDLPLAKLLLGLQPTQGLALPPAVLDEADQAEVQALLQAVRHHWPALRGSSVQTLQLSFLQRRGLLRRVDAQQAGAGWQLQVHNESFDLLLASLPWALQWVRLPWMPQPLAVDWPVPL